MQNQCPKQVLFMENGVTHGIGFLLFVGILGFFGKDNCIIVIFCEVDAFGSNGRVRSMPTK